MVGTHSTWCLVHPRLGTKCSADKEQHRLSTDWNVEACACISTCIQAQGVKNNGQSQASAGPVVVRPPSQPPSVNVRTQEAIEVTFRACSGPSFFAAALPSCAPTPRAPARPCGSARTPGAQQRMSLLNAKHPAPGASGQIFHASAADDPL